ncbi:MAG: hypothetical protein ABFC63_07700 [Thermoguttaceae bacterium]
MFANVGIPLIGPAIGVGWFAFIPVVLVETLIAIWVLRWQFFFALRWVSLANVVTTFVGVPITWFLTVLVQMSVGYCGWGDGSIVEVLLGPAWLGPGYIRDLGWAVPLGLIVLCVPMFVMSCWAEYLILRRFAAKALIWQYVWKANLASYALLVAALIVTMLCLSF